MVWPQLKQGNRSVLVCFSNGVRGAKRLSAANALGDLDDDVSWHGHSIQAPPSLVVFSTRAGEDPAGTPGRAVTSRGNRHLRGFDEASCRRGWRRLGQ